MRIRLLSFIYAPHPALAALTELRAGQAFRPGSRAARTFWPLCVPPPAPVRLHPHAAISTHGQSATSATSFLGHELAAAPLALASAATRLRRFIKKAASRLTPK